MLRNFLIAAVAVALFSIHCDAVGLQKRGACNADSCLRALKPGGTLIASALSDCTSYMSPPGTNTASLPTYAATCQSGPRYLSACSCLAASSTATTSKTSSSTITPTNTNVLTTLTITSTISATTTQLSNATVTVTQIVATTLAVNNTQISTVSETRTVTTTLSQSQDCPAVNANITATTASNSTAVAAAPTSVQCMPILTLFAIYEDGSKGDFVSLNSYTNDPQLYYMFLTPLRNGAHFAQNFSDNSLYSTIGIYAGQRWTYTPHASVGSYTSIRLDGPKADGDDYVSCTATNGALSCGTLYYQEMWNCDQVLALIVAGVDLSPYCTLKKKISSLLQVYDNRQPCWATRFS